MTKPLISALAAAAAAGLLAAPAPLLAAAQFDTAPHAQVASGDTWNQYQSYHRDDRRYHRDDRRYAHGDDRRYNGRVWRGRDGRYRCHRDDGTTGLLIGGAAGALLGRTIDTGRDRTAGTVLGAAGGALLGRHIDRSDSRCR